MTPEGLSQLKTEEGLRLTAYPDPLTGGAPWTIGYGHTGAEVRRGLAWTKAQAEAALAADVAKAEAALAKAIPWFSALDPVRRDVLADMAFNLGVASLLQFRSTLAAVQRGDYAAASEGMLASLWVRQVGGRARVLAEQMRTGRRS